MKNLFKTRIATLLGITALIVVIGFTMTACPGEPDDEGETWPAPSGTVTLVADYGAFVGLPLKVTYTGDSTVQYSWNGGSWGTNTTYTPTAAGAVTVSVRDKDAADQAGPNDTINTQDKSITVAAAPDYIAYIGKWNWSGTTTRAFDETIVIKSDGFRLDSTFNEGEYLSFTGLTWEENEDIATGEGSMAGYTKSYKVTYTATANSGYPNWSATGSFYLYLNDGTSTIKIKRSAAGGANTAIDREYTKQPF